MKQEKKVSNGGSKGGDGNQELETLHGESNHHGRESKAEEESSTSSPREPSLVISAPKQVFLRTK